MAEEDHTVSRAKDQPGGQVQRMELQALLARVEAATGWNDDLDVLILMDVDPQYGRERKIQKIKIGNYPAYTASLDAALALAERFFPGVFFHLSRFADDDASEAHIYPNRGLGDDYRGEAKTPPLAILAALLTALSHQQPHDQIREGEGQ